MPYSLSTQIKTQGGSATASKRLSICLDADGFSYAERSADGTLLSLGVLHGNHPASMTDALRDAKAAFAQANIQPLAYSGIELIVISNQSLWVPDEVYSPASIRHYQQLVGATTGQTSTCNCAAIAATAVFAANEHLITAFKVALPGATTMHQHAKMVQFAPLSKNHNIVAVHWRKGYIDVAAFKEGRYIYGNTLAPADDNEARYRIVEVTRTHGIESPSTELMLMGQIDRTRYALVAQHFAKATLYTGQAKLPADPAFRTLHTYRHALILT